MGYQQILREINNVLGQEEPYKKERLTLLNSYLLASSIAPKERMNDIRIFVKSVFFMYIPAIPKNEKDLPFDIVASNPTHKDEYVFNPLYHLVSLHKLRITIMMGSNTTSLSPRTALDHRQIVESLSSIAENPDSIKDPEIKASIEKSREMVSAIDYNKWSIKIITYIFFCKKLKNRLYTNNYLKNINKLHKNKSHKINHIK